MDIAQINAVLGLASGAAGLTTQAAQTVQAIKDLFARSKSDGKDEMTDLLNALVTELTSANLLNLRLSNALSEISESVAKDIYFEQKMKRYQLFTTNQGDIVYQLQDEFIKNDPPHYICPICIEKNKAFHFVVGSSNERGKRCQGCGHYFIFRESNPIKRTTGGF